MDVACETFFTNLVDNVLDYLSLLDMINLSNTNRYLRRRLPLYLSRELNDILRTFVPDPISFRAALRRTGSVISGSTALHFAVRPHLWSPRDIDICTPNGSATEEMAAHIVYVQGFHSTSCTRNVVTYDDSGPLPGIKNTHHYEFPDNAGPHERRCLDLIQSVTSSPITPIISFHSTMDMNYLTADSLVILYPELTLKKCKAVAQIPFTGQEPWAAKYAARGFALNDLYPFCHTTSPYLLRRTTDEHTLRILFTSNQGYVPNDTTFSTDWTLGHIHFYSPC